MAFWEGVKIDSESKDMKKLLKLAVAKGREAIHGKDEPKKPSVVPS
jgi:hypothetical protein